jgi:hypothetical protein
VIAAPIAASSRGDAVLGLEPVSQLVDDRQQLPPIRGHDLPLVETSLLADRSAVFGVLGQIEALGLELLELRQIRARRESPESGGARSPDGVGG